MNPRGFFNFNFSIFLVLMVLGNRDYIRACTFGSQVNPSYSKYLFGRRMLFQYFGFTLSMVFIILPFQPMYRELLQTQSMTIRGNLDFDRKYRTLENVEKIKNIEKLISRKEIAESEKKYLEAKEKRLREKLKERDVSFY